ncbi:MAG: hypothetical protein KAR20_18680, partial [Candidatus Heimdallarchaeota archaeon]|nr:hypothetical protein [Candidatus Heimdallarchaeota archaeon]
MAKNSIALMAICVLLCGCMTTGKFTKTLSSNWGMSPTETKAELNHDPVEEKRLNSDITIQRYSPYDPWWSKHDDYILYFKDDKLVRYSPYTESNHYESMYKLGVISIDQYRNYLDLRQKQVEHEIQMDSLRQQQAYQRQILRNQEKALEIQEEALQEQKRKNFRDSL